MKGGEGGRTRSEGKGEERGKNWRDVKGRNNEGRRTVPMKSRGEGDMTGEEGEEQAVKERERKEGRIGRLMNGEM